MNQAIIITGRSYYKPLLLEESTMNMAQPDYISRLFFTLLLSILISTSISSFATAGPKGGRFMSFFDTNNDKMVTMDELNVSSKIRFAKMDADNNKVVSVDEFSDYITQRRQQRRIKGFNKVDQDRNGRVSSEEYMTFKQQQAEERFQQLDINNDGYVSSDEFISAKHRRHGKRRGRGKRFFTKLDANADGHITRDESVIAWSNWFKRIDADHDEVVTADEVSTFRSNFSNDRHKH